MENDQLASALRTSISKMNKRLRKHMNSADSLSMSELDTLSYLYHTESLSPSALAELNHIRGQSMSEVLTRLEKLTIIDKKQSLTDKRKFDVSLTAYGRDIVEQTRYQRDEWLSNAIENKLSASEKSTLKEALALIDKLSDFQ